jgi:hypothetical protein
VLPLLVIDGLARGLSCAHSEEAIVSAINTDKTRLRVIFSIIKPSLIPDITYRWQSYRFGRRSPRLKKRTGPDYL